MGERRRLTAIGDAVNLASRIESANKDAATELLVSEDAHEPVKDHFRFGKCFEFRIKGKTGQYSLYEVLGAVSPAG